MTSPRSGRVRQARETLLAGCRRLGGIVWPFRKTREPRLQPADWLERLTEEKGFLLSLVGAMETEFLATGGGLMRVAGQLNKIQQDCRSLTELTLAQSQDAAVQFSFQLLKKAEDLVLASYEQYEHVFATFGELKERLAHLLKFHDELIRVLLPLNFITTAFRIEASRHSEEVRDVFFTLAGTVTRTVTEVRGTLERQFEDLAASERIARTLMEQVSTSTQRHRQAVTSTLATSRIHLRRLSEALTNSSAGAADLAHQNQSVTRHIGSIVTAQQCQDITRQRIEHVGEAMDEMHLHLGEAGPARDAAARPFIVRAGKIQLHQIQSVFDQLNRAADGLTSGIQNLRTDVGKAAEAAVTIGSATLDAKVAGPCQAGISEILAFVKQAVQQIADILAAFEPLQASVVNCTNQATVLAGDVRYAGLNAQVFAIHAPDGATLEVLAGRVREISDQTIDQVEQMGAALQHTVEMVNNLRQRLEDFQVLGQAEEDILADESARSQQGLADLETAIPILIGRIAKQQETLSQSVEEILGNVRFPAAVASASSRSIGFFRDIVAWGSEGGSGSVAESEASQKLDLLNSKYTMDSERHAHAAALQPALAAAGATAADSAFEMFDDFSSPAPAAADSPGEIVPPIERAEAQPRPAELAASEMIPPTAPPALASKKPAASEDLGDNVDLF